MKTDRNEKTDVATQNQDIIKKLNALQKQEHQSAHIKEWEFIAPKFSVKD